MMDQEQIQVVQQNTSWEMFQCRKLYDIFIATEQKEVTGQSIIQMHGCQYQVGGDKERRIICLHWLSGWFKGLYANTHSIGFSWQPQGYGLNTEVGNEWMEGD